jgi:integrase/recombinase XerD
LRAERVVAPSGRVAWTVVDAGGVAVAPAEAFLRYRFDCEASPNTLRAYAHDLKLFFGFLAERSLGWRELSPAELGEFVAWLRRPAGNVLLLPGMPPARAASTVNRALSAVMSFYEFHRLRGIELADLMLDPLRSGRGGFRPFLAGIARDSARGRRDRMPVARRAPRVLSLEQVARVVAGQSRLRDRLLFVLLFTTGMRIGQALQIGGSGGAGCLRGRTVSGSPSRRSALPFDDLGTFRCNRKLVSPRSSRYFSSEGSPKRANSRLDTNATIALTRSPSKESTSIDLAT